MSFMSRTGFVPKDPRASEAMRRWDELKSARAPHERDWEELARLIRPQRGGFTSADPAQHRDDKPLSSAPIIAQENFRAGLYGTMTNPANRWMSLSFDDADLATWGPNRQWLDMATDRVLRSFQPSVSPFYSAAVQLFGDISTFGNAAQYDEVRPAEQKILDITLSLAEVCYAIDGFGRVIEVVRKFRLTGRQAVDMFGIERMPPKLQEMAEKGSADLVDFFHHVFRNMDWKRGKLGPRGKEWLSLYVCSEAQCVVRESGYAEMPFNAPRWDVDTGQTYGRGPGMIALPDTRVLTQMDAANLRSGQHAADPTLLAPDRDTWALNGAVRPGEVVYGGVNGRGEVLIRPLDRSGGTGLTLEMQQARIENIRDAFHWSLMNLAGRTGMTATEVVAIQEEKLRLMAPHMGRLQEEYLAPKIQRRFFLLFRAGQIPPPPPDLAQRGASLSVEYLSAAAMAQKSAEGLGVRRILQDITPLAELMPRLRERMSEDDLVEVLVESSGAPSRILRSREEADAIGEQRAQQQQAMQAMEMAKAGGGVMKDLAGAQAQMAPAGAA